MAKASNIRKYFYREVLQGFEKELKRNKKRVTLPPCDDGVVQVVKNTHRKARLRDAKPGEVVEVNLIILKGQNHYEQLLEQRREGAYRSCHLGCWAHTGPTMKAQEFIHHLAEGIGRWNASNQEFSAMKEIFLKNVETLKNVNRVVCFGLGRLEEPFAETATYPSVSMMQHVAVYEMARFIKEQINTDRRWPRIYIQDPDYSTVEKSVLKKALRMTPVGGFGAHGFLLVTKNTIVVTHRATFPIREIIMDLSKPAAMFVQEKAKQNGVDPMPERTKRAMDDEYLESQVVTERMIFPQNSWYVRTQLQ